NPRAVGKKRAHPRNDDFLVVNSKTTAGKPLLLVLASQFFYGFRTMTGCGADLLTSMSALTFWICAACCFTVATRSATVASNFSTFRCSLRNSLSNIAFTAV